MHMNARLRQLAGFSTLEALAALMLVNLLCLGSLAMQLQALQTQRDALALQNAVALAQDLWERMRINPQAAQTYQLRPGQTTSTVDCQSKACNASAWAQSDLAAWQTMVQLRLPGALTQLNTNSLSQVQLWIAWPLKDDALTPSEVPGSDCPARHRCWQTRWTL